MMRISERRGINRRIYFAYVCEECRLIGTKSDLAKIPTHCPDCGWGRYEKRRWYRKVYRKPS